MQIHSSTGTRRTFLKQTGLTVGVLALPNIWVPSVAAKDKEGFRSIFDGKSLKGWHINPKRIGHGTGGQWYVQKDAITGE